MISDFEKSFPDYRLSFRLVAPAESLAAGVPVKSVTLTRPKRMRDNSDVYMRGRKLEDVNYELTIRANRRGGVIAMIKDLRDAFSSVSDGFVSFEGHEFEGVKAEVLVGKKRRVVGIFGSGHDAGLIDVSENVKRGDGGHPLFSSIETEVDSMMEEFFAGLNENAKN